MNEDRCEHCKRSFAFALYQLVTAPYSFWVTNDRHEREQIWVDSKHITRKLCADCGFNIVNLRKASRGEYHELKKTPNGDQYVQGEFMMQRRIYISCTLIMMLHNTETIEHAKRLSREAMLQRIEEGKSEYQRQLDAMRAKLGVSQPTRREERPVREVSRGGAVRRAGTNLIGTAEATTPPPHTIETRSISEAQVVQAPAARIGPAPRTGRRL